jgi:hypothetical protein
MSVRICKLILHVCIFFIRYDKIYVTYWRRTLIGCGRRHNENKILNNNVEMVKLIPIFSTNGFSFLFTQINVTVPFIRKYSRFSQIIPFTILILTILVKVYQLSFVGQVTDPFERTIYWIFSKYHSSVVKLPEMGILVRNRAPTSITYFKLSTI